MVRGTYSYQDGSQVLNADWDHGCARRKYHVSSEFPDDETTDTG